MNEYFTYDPEDLESLLMHKTFADLYPEEKLFVLKHMDSEEEYASMRETLLAVQSSADNDANLTMPASTKASLMDAFKKERKRGAWFTLNGLFALLLPPQKPWYGKPAFQLASVGLLLFVGSTFFNVFSPEPNLQIAEAKTEEFENIKTSPKQSTQSTSNEQTKEEANTTTFEDNIILEENEEVLSAPVESKDQDDIEMESPPNDQRENADVEFRDDELNLDLAQADVAMDTNEDITPARTATPTIANIPTEESFVDADANTATAYFNSPTTTATVPAEITVSAEKKHGTKSIDKVAYTTAADLSDVMTLLEAAY